jgi:hypothetical protein
VNGWILLTFQSSYIESRRFSSLGKIATAIYENFGFYLALGIINTIGNYSGRWCLINKFYNKSKMQLVGI